MDVSLQVRLSITTLTIFLPHLSGLVLGSVTITPEPIASVCRGHQLDLTCCVTGTHLRWTFSLIREGQPTAKPYKITLTSQNQANQLRSLIVDSTMFTVLRSSAANNSMPLVSGLTINSTNDRLNGTRVMCSNVQTSESVSTTIHVISINESLFKDIELEIAVVSEQFEQAGVTVTLELTEENNPLQDSLYSYNVSVSPPVMFYTERARIQLRVPYNTFHNVSIISAATPPCQQNSVIRFVDTTLYFIKCRNVADVAYEGIIINGYSDPAKEGSNITIGCSSHFVPYTSTCMANGEWEPDPENFKLNCSDNTMTTKSMMMITSSDAERLNYGITLGSALGAIVFILLVIASIIVISVSFGKAKFKHSSSNNIRELDDYERYTYMSNEKINTNTELTSRPSHDGHETATSNLMYAEIGLSFPSQHTISTINLDDDVIEYARLNHSLLSPTAMSQKSQSANLNANSPCVNLDNLLIQLRSQITPMWYEFGEAAGIGKEVLDDCAKTCSPEDCIVEMLDYWLRNSVQQPTWKDIGGILRAIGLQQLAFDIERVYTTGKLPVELDMDQIPQLQLMARSTPPIPPRIMESSTLTPTDQEVDHNDQDIKADQLPPSLPPKPMDI